MSEGRLIKDASELKPGMRLRVEWEAAPASTLELERCRRGSLWDVVDMEDNGGSMRTFRDLDLAISDGRVRLLSEPSPAPDEITVGSEWERFDGSCYAVVVDIAPGEIRYERVYARKREPVANSESLFRELYPTRRQPKAAPVPVPAPVKVPPIVCADCHEAGDWPARVVVPLRKRGAKTMRMCDPCYLEREASVANRNVSVPDNLVAAPEPPRMGPPIPTRDCGLFSGHGTPRWVRR